MEILGNTINGPTYESAVELPFAMNVVFRTEIIDDFEDGAVDAQWVTGTGLTVAETNGALYNTNFPNNGYVELNLDLSTLEIGEGIFMPVMFPMRHDGGGGGAANSGVAVSVGGTTIFSADNSSGVGTAYNASAGALTVFKIASDQYVATGDKGTDTADNKRWRTLNLGGAPKIRLTTTTNVASGKGGFVIPFCMKFASDSNTLWSPHGSFALGSTLHPNGWDNGLDSRFWVGSYCDTTVNATLFSKDLKGFRRVMTCGCFRQANDKLTIFSGDHVDSQAEANDSNPDATAYIVKLTMDADGNSYDATVNTWVTSVATPMTTATATNTRDTSTWDGDLVIGVDNGNVSTDHHNCGWFLTRDFDL